MHIARTWTFVLSVGVFAAAPLGSAALAQDGCTKPLKIVASLPMTRHVDMMTVPILLNGVSKDFLISTEAPLPTLSLAVATQLNLPTSAGQTGVRNGETGESTHRHAMVDVNIGGLVAPKMELQLSPDPHWDGIFAPLAFKAYDFDFDFANAKLNMVSKDHCDGQVVYWPHQALAVVPITMEGPKMTVPVLLNGKKFKGVISTSVLSSLRLDEAERVFGLKTDSPDMKPISYINRDPKFPVYQYQFQTLAFDGITINNPQLQLPTDPMSTNNAFQTGHAIKQENNIIPEVTIGMDVLTKLHIYLATGEKRLYVTEAGNAAGPAAPPP